MTNDRQPLSSQAILMIKQKSKKCIFSAILLGSVFGSSAQGQAATIAESMKAEVEAFPSLIECRATLGDYTSLAPDIAAVTTPEGLRSALDLAEDPVDDLFVRRFHLPAPITVFGRQTSTILFSGSGMVGVFDEADPRRLADELRVSIRVVSLTGPPVFHGERLIAHDDLAMMSTATALIVATDQKFPGKTMAGCNYTFEIHDEVSDATKRPNHRLPHRVD